MGSANIDRGAMLWIICLVVIVQVFCQSAEEPTNREMKCRDRNGYWDVPSFRLFTCATCYGYLFPMGKELKTYQRWLVSVNGTVYPHLTMLVPDIHNATQKQEVCRTLNTDECIRWTECCVGAETCCQQQRDHARASLARNDVMEEGENGYCPGTWDGYACWRDTDAGTTVSVACPAFIQHAVPKVNAYKTCTSNATWYRDPATQLEWTNYTSCLSVEPIKRGIIINVACNSLSLALLLPAVVIFCCYRTLRGQHRIRLHINLFVSFTFTNIIFILWDLLIVYDRLVSSTTLSRMRANTPGCKFLYVLTRYSRSSNFLCMLLEGYYLHRLIVKAFEPPKSLVPFYVLAWAFPWLPVTIYSILRALYADKSCWVQSFGQYEWLIYIPNLLSLTMNLFFLVNILRILLTQLQAHPNEPSNYRRALRATFVLIPLFGIQLIFIIYRPPASVSGATEYAVFEAIVTHSQGFFVALVFCFLNGEVISHLRGSIGRYANKKNQWENKHSFSASTQLTHIEQFSSMGSGRKNSLRSASILQNRSYIPMKAITETNGEAK